MEQGAKPALRHLLRFEPLRVPDDAGLLAGTQRGDHDRAGSGGGTLRHAIIERARAALSRRTRTRFILALDRVSGGKRQ